MAGKKLTELTEVTSLGSTKLLYGVDSARTVGDQSIGISKENLLKASTSTGLAITFVEDTIYNGATYLTSGNLTLSLTDANVGVVAICYCNGYAPTISGEDYFISSGALDSNSLNVLSFMYDGSNIYLNIGNVASLSAPTLVLTPGDTEMQVDWSAITNADNYVIERADDSGFTTNKTEIYNGALLTVTDTGLTNGQTYYFRGKSQGAGYVESAWSATVSDAPEAGTDFTTSLVASYQFESNANDYTTNHNGSETGTPTYASAKVGNGIDFDGSTQYVTVTDHNDFSFTDGAGNDAALSIAFWIKPDGPSGTYSVMSKYGGGTTAEWEVLHKTNVCWLRLYDQGQLVDRIEVGVTITDGVWTHICYTYDGTNSETGLTLYKNGTDSLQTPIEQGTYVQMNNYTADVYMGRRYDGSLDWAGNLDEVKFYNGRELSAAEVLEMYNDENGGTSVLP